MAARPAYRKPNALSAEDPRIGALGLLRDGMLTVSDTRPDELLSVFKKSRRYHFVLRMHSGHAITFQAFAPNDNVPVEGLVFDIKDLVEVAFFNPKQALTLGTTVFIIRRGLGTLRYLGRCHDGSEDVVGVELFKETGEHNGVFRGHKYFTCPQGRGVIVPVSDLRIMDGNAEPVNVPLSKNFWLRVGFDSPRLPLGRRVIYLSTGSYIDLVAWYLALCEAKAGTTAVAAPHVHLERVPVVLNSVEDSAASGVARTHGVQAHRAAAANALLFRPPSDDRPQSVHSRSYSAEKHEFPKRTSPIFSRWMEFSWFHGFLSREDAELRLKRAGCRDGGFLVRQSASQKETVVISYCWQKTFIHFALTWMPSVKLSETLDAVLDYLRAPQEAISWTSPLQFFVSRNDCEQSQTGEVIAHRFRALHHTRQLSPEFEQHHRIFKEVGLNTPANSAASSQESAHDPFALGSNNSASLLNSVRHLSINSPNPATSTTPVPGFTARPSSTVTVVNAADLTLPSRRVTEISPMLIPDDISSDITPAISPMIARDITPTPPHRQSMVASGTEAQHSAFLKPQARSLTKLTINSPNTSPSDVSSPVNKLAPVAEVDWTDRTPTLSKPPSEIIETDL